MPKTVSNQISLYLKGKRNALQQAECYYRGLYVERDIAVAEELYRQAARENLPGAHFRLGLFYHHQAGRDEAAAKAYFNAFLDGELRAKIALLELTRAPSIAAHCYLGKIFEAEGNRLEAQKAYHTAIDGGSTIAIFYLAQWYEADPRHCLTALREYQRAWFNGFTPALAALKAHAKTVPAAALLLGESYERIHDDREKNIINAYQYYMDAVNLGCLDALDSLERLAEAGSRKMKMELAQLYRSHHVSKPLEALRWEVKLEIATVAPPDLSYARVALTVFSKLPVIRSRAQTLVAEINQCNGVHSK